MSKRRLRGVGSNPSRCYLCGLPIPSEIVCPTHPLFGTVDHVIPRSRNGPNSMFNRMPAHRFCNEQKGNGMVNPEEFAGELQVKVVSLLQGLGRKVTAGKQRAAKRRVVERWPTWAPVLKTEPMRTALCRWEEEGGSVLPLPPDRRSRSGP